MYTAHYVGSVHCAYRFVKNFKDYVVINFDHFLMLFSMPLCLQYPLLGIF